MKTWLKYAAWGLGVVGVGVLGAVLLTDGPTQQAVMVSAVIAYVVQLAAFGMLIAFREKSNLFLAGWLLGMVLRFGVLGLAAFAATRSEVLPRSALLLSLVGFVFLLLLLEPVFLRGDLRRS